MHKWTWHFKIAAIGIVITGSLVAPVFYLISPEKRSRLVLSGFESEALLEIATYWNEISNERRIPLKLKESMAITRAWGTFNNGEILRLKMHTIGWKRPEEILQLDIDLSSGRIKWSEFATEAEPNEIILAID